MRIWLISTGDPLPCDGSHVRPHRNGMLAEELVARGHEVVWWSSTFDHHRKRHRFREDTELQPAPGLRMRLLHSCGYARNVSLARVRDHRQVARRFARAAAAAPPPDRILCSWPTIDLGVAAVGYGRARGVPVLLDVRDLWPDVFRDLVPRGLRPLGRAAFRPLVARTRRAFEDADGLVSMSDGCLRWALKYAARTARPCDAVFPLAYPRAKVDQPALVEAERSIRTLGVDPSRFLCWFVGGFGNTVDLETVIDAAREVQARGLDEIQFVFSGDGDQRARWTSMARDLRNVVFTGWIEVPQIAYLMSVAKIGLLAMRFIPEALPNKLFEYLAAGLPVLSSIPGEAEGLLARHDCGMTYRAGDPPALLTALLSLYRDEPRRRALAENARRAYETDYAADVVYPRMATFLEKAGARRQTPGKEVASREA